MRRFLSQLVVIFCSLGLLLSGTQTVTGYYSDPSGYGFHHLQSAYFHISIALTLLGVMAIVIVMKRLERLLW